MMLKEKTILTSLDGHQTQQYKNWNAKTSNFDKAFFWNLLYKMSSSLDPTHKKLTWIFNNSISDFNWWQSGHTLILAFHNELKRGKKSILAGQYVFASKAKIYIFWNFFEWRIPMGIRSDEFFFKKHWF